MAFIGRSIKLRLTGTNPFVIGKGKKGLKEFVEILFIPVLVFWSWEVLRQSMNIDISILPGFIYEKLQLSIFVGLSGITLTIAGFVLFIMALVSFGDSWRIGIDNGKPADLITEGVFRFSRNPVFLFIDLYFLGTFLVYPSLFFGLSFVIVALLFQYQIVQEEKHLKKIYGEKYAKYMEKAHRYFGF
jgi:protein-S-isoprenylcysteine O-methyltransferase Ste14